MYVSPRYIGETSDKTVLQLPVTYTAFSGTVG